MHTLDLIIYIVLCIIIWAFLPDDFKMEIGVLMGLCIMLVFSIIYLVLFVIYPDFNWIDIFKGLEFKL